jgi:hypothetical protein
MSVIERHRRKPRGSVAELADAEDSKASHITTNLDAAAINVRRPKPVKKKVARKPSKAVSRRAEA